MTRTNLMVAFATLFLGAFGVLYGLNPHNNDHSTALLIGVLLLISSVTLFVTDYFGHKE